jgi:hypothetical protein
MGAHQAQATLLTYGLTVAGGCFGSNTPPFGLSSNPTITGTFTVDNTETGVAAFNAISVITGTMTWDQTMLNPDVFFVETNFDAVGDLTSFIFSLGSGPDQTGSFLIAASNNTFDLHDGLGNIIACNNCVSFERSQPTVPEPSSLVALVTAMVALALCTTAKRSRTRLLASSD